MNVLPIPRELYAWIYQAGKWTQADNRQVWQKQNHSLLTSLDLKIESFLAENIHAAYPDHALIGEEGVSEIRASSWTWTIDPLDGTAAFVLGLPEWGISVGLLHKNRPVFGLYYMPRLEEWVFTQVNGVHTKNHLEQIEILPLLQPEWRLKGFLAVTGANSHRRFAIGIDRVRTVGSVSTALAYVARGVATAALIPRARLWDLVPGAAMLGRLGGELRYLSGKPIVYEALRNGRLAPEPVIAGHPQILDEIQTQVQKLEI